MGFNFFPTVETQPREPSFLCDLFGCKTHMVKTDENNGYWECNKCDNKEYFSTFSWEFTFNPLDENV